MSKTEQRGLQRIDFGNRLPAGFEALTQEEKNNVIRRLLDQDLDLRKELLSKLGKSELAEHDLAVAIDTVQRLDHERKVYSNHVKGETGSGTYDLKVRGGDTKFIIPILVVVGLVILGIAFIMAAK